MQVKTFNRSTAPHLTIYNVRFFSFLSILHRISGVILALYIHLFFVFTTIITQIITFFPDIQNYCTFIFFYKITLFFIGVFNLFFFYHFWKGLTLLFVEQEQIFSTYNINNTFQKKFIISGVIVGFLIGIYYY